MATAWKKVSEDAIKKCFLKERFSRNGGLKLVDNILLVQLFPSIHLTVSQEDLAIENCSLEMVEISGFQSNTNSEYKEYENIESNTLTLSEADLCLKPTFYKV